MSARMPVCVRRIGVVRMGWSLLLVCALAMSGCANCRLPRIDPTGEHLFVPAGAAPAPTVPAPVGPPRPAPLGGVPLAVFITPSQVSAPIGSEVLLISSVGTQGYLLTHQRVDWTISGESVGNFVSPGIRRPLAILDWVHGVPRLVDPRYVMNSTLFYPTTLEHGTATPLDDIRIQSGQAWVTVTSPIEGTTHVTAFAPAVTAWDRRQQTASIYWIDAQWRLPSPAIANLGGRSTLSTIVSRQSNGVGLAGWQVRYEIAGGPEAGFAPDGAPSIVAVTSETGEASAEILQKQDAAGVNQVNVQVIRPAGVGGQSPQLTVGSGATSLTWTGAAGSMPADVPTATPTPPSTPPPQAAPAAAAQLEVTVNGPSSAVVGGQVHCEIQVVNRGTAPAAKVLISDRFDSGLRRGGSSAPIEHDLVDIRPGGMVRLSVTLEAVASGEQCQDIEVRAEGVQPATARHCVTVADREVQPTPIEPKAPTDAAQPPRETQPPAAESRPSGPATLSVRKTGPDRRRVGETVLFTIEVTNTGEQPLDDLVIADRFETVLEPQRATDGNEWLEGGGLGWKVSTLGPGRTVRREVEFKCLREVPRACNRVTLSAKGVQSITEEVCLAIGDDQAQNPQQPAVPQASPVSVSVADTADPIKIGGLTTYQVLVENKGDKSQFNVAVSVTLSEGLKLDGVTGPVQGSVTSGAIKFAPIRELRAGEPPLVYELRAKAIRAGTAQARVEVTSQGQTTPATAEQTTQILP